MTPARKRDYLSKFRELIESPPKRTGKPLNPEPFANEEDLERTVILVHALDQGFKH